MKNQKLSVSLLVAWLAVESAFANDPQVETQFGTIRGTWLKTYRGANITAYLGVPYAQAPVDELRFENPRPWTEKWSGVRNATMDNAGCLQLDVDRVIGTEDCLFLNVFTPNMSAVGNETEKKKLSVLMYIHGGIFAFNSANSTFLGPSYLLDNEIILVTFNFRLNILGFFSTGNSVAPGNYGLKDAAMALAWVHDNIEAFGGDPNSVTLMGHSSGGVMVQLLAANQATEGHFQKMITMSSSLLMPCSIQSRASARNTSLHVASLVGCANESDSDDIGSGDGENGTIAEYEDVFHDATRQEKIDRKIKRCMKMANPMEIVGNSFIEVWRQFPQAVYMPTLESEAEGAILTELPEWRADGSLFRDMPWIHGVVPDEGLQQSTDFLLNSNLKDELLADFDRLYPYVTQLFDRLNNQTEFMREVKDFYFDGDVQKNFEANIAPAVGDPMFTFPVFDCLEKQSKHMRSNVYFYQFEYEGTFSMTFRWGIPFRFGVGHGDDLNYVFPFLNQQWADLQLSNTLSDETMISTMTEMWTNFARTGIPSARLTSSDWEPYQKAGRYMRIGNGRSTDRAMVDGPFQPERMQFWRELLGNYSLPVEYRVDEPAEEHPVAGAAARMEFTGITLGLAVVGWSRWIILAS